jgi:O-antigen/teichoic acid export membrane protein
LYQSFLVEITQFSVKFTGMSEQLFKGAGLAMIWQGIQIGGVKVIFLVRTLVLARLLVPEDFGLFVVATVPIGFLLSITDFGLVPALIQREDVTEQHYHAAWSIGILRALAISAVVFLAAPLIAQVFAEPRAIIFIQVLAIRPIIEAMSSIKMANLIRNLQFRSITAVKLAEALANTIIAILLAQRYGIWALVFGIICGSIGYAIASYIVAPYRPRFIYNVEVSRPLVRYGRWIFITSLIGVFGGVVLQVVISRRLGAVELGLYFLAAKLAFLPAEVASEVVGNVTFPLYARLQTHKAEAAQAFRAILSGMYAILLPLSVLLMVLSPSLVNHVLGAKWAGTESIIRVLVLVTIIGLFGEVTVPIFKGVGQPDKLVWLKVTQIGLIMAAAWPLAGHFGVTGAAAAWLPAIAITQLFSYYFIRRQLPQPFNGLLKLMTAVLVASFGGALVAFCIDTFLPSLVGFILACLSAAAVIIGLYWYQERRFQLGFADNLVLLFPQLNDYLAAKSRT